MSVNIRDYVSDDHVESIGEIARSQSAIIQALSIENGNLQNQLQQKENIIKEVREYIKENSIYYPTSDGCQWVDQFKVLEILDKENKECLN